MTVAPVPPLASLAPSRVPRARPAWPWHQLAVHSPLPLRTAWRGARLGMAGDDSRSRARALVRVLYRAEDAWLVGSGTEALSLAIAAAARLIGDTSAVVALPAYTCYDVATAAVAADAPIALYDVDPATLAPDMASLTATLAEGARVVVVAPLYGVPVDWDAIEQCARTFGAVAVEDAAQGHGAAWRGRPLGSLGRLSVLSFGRGKGWTAGQGGALLARDGVRLPEGAPPDPGAVGEVSVAFGALAHAGLGRPHIYGVPAAIPWLHLGETRYREPRQPRAMSRTAAALLERTLPLATHEAEVRRRNAVMAQGLLEGRPGIRSVTAPPAGTPGYLRLPLRLARGLDGLADPALARRLGVARGYPATLAALPAVVKRLARGGRGRGRWPGAEELVRELVTLPTHSLVSETDRDELVRLLERQQ